MANNRAYFYCNLCKQRGPQVMKYYPATCWYVTSGGEREERQNNWLEEHTHDQHKNGNGPTHFRLVYEVEFPEPWTTEAPTAPGDFIAVPTARAKDLLLKYLDSPCLVRVFIDEKYGLNVMTAGEEGWLEVGDFTHWYALPNAPELP